jgi:Na+-driven multidrug efflux pump
VLNGCGRQQISANIGIVSWYFLGLPLGALLCFIMELELVRLATLDLLKQTLRNFVNHHHDLWVPFGEQAGLWMGLALGLVLSVGVLSFTVLRTNWDQQARKAVARSNSK